MSHVLASRFKHTGKKLLRLAGIEAHSYIPGSSREAQLAAAMRHFGITHVLDIGANTGQFGAELIANGYRGRIVSIEPLPDAHHKLAGAAARHPQWTVHPPTAVGGQAGHVQFHVAANSVSSSALPVLDASVAAAPESRQVQQLTVPLTTVLALLEQYELPSSGALLKADTQGFEWQVLDGAGARLNQFQAVLLELSLAPLYQGQRLWLDVVDRMNRSGFDLWLVQPEFVDPASGRTLQVNGLFCRRSVS